MNATKMDTMHSAIASLRSPVAKSSLASPVIGAFTSADGATNVVKPSSGLIALAQLKKLSPFGLATPEGSITHNRTSESFVKKVNARPTMQRCMACTP